MLLITGLGNPGKEYEKTRHNVGFMVIDHLIKSLKPTNVSKASFKGELFKKDSTFFLKPTTYMNLSGESVFLVSQFYKISEILVIHDELDLHFGTVKYKIGGGNGGHNGLKSIDSKLTSNYKRVRIGIDKPPIKSMVADYVLSQFSEEEKIVLPKLIQDVSEAILDIIHGEVFEKIAATKSGKRL